MSASGEVPPDALETCRVSVVQYVTTEGALYWNLDWTEDAPLTQIVGLLSIAQMEMFARANRKDEQ